MIQLYPASGELLPLKGTYLALNLHERAMPNEVFIYANFIQSLDGRISQLDAVTGEYAVPASIANTRDWRLYQELAGQSDVMLTSARYFRQLAKGCAQDLLPVGSSPQYEDIRLWREQQGLKPQPDVVVLSNSIDIPLTSLSGLNGRNITVLTHKMASQEKIQKLEDSGVQVICAQEAVSGQFISKTLIDLGYRSAYMIAGPKVHHTLAAEDCLDELFLTSQFTFLGGESCHTLLDETIAPIKMNLKSLYFDAQENQMFMRYQYQKRGM